VLTLPPGAVVLASSPTAPYELWSWGTNVLASQFHIEFDEPLVLDKIWTSLTNVGRLTAQQSADSRRVLEAGGQHSVQMLQVCGGDGGAEAPTSCCVCLSIQQTAAETWTLQLWKSPCSSL
jgi:GMP synthase-like glutamine amidotransferase